MWTISEDQPLEILLEDILLVLKSLQLLKIKFVKLNHVMVIKNVKEGLKARVPKYKWSSIDGQDTVFSEDRTVMSKHDDLWKVITQ